MLEVCVDVRVEERRRRKWVERGKSAAGGFLFCLGMGGSSGVARGETWLVGEVEGISLLLLPPLLSWHEKGASGVAG